MKDQERCGASWAFSATGALEGQLYKSTRRLKSLSEQQLLDCTVKFGNTGCSGGLATNAYRYLQTSGGICEESSYPYLGYVRRYFSLCVVGQTVLFCRCITVLTNTAPKKGHVLPIHSCLLVVKIHYSVTHTTLGPSGLHYLLCTPEIDTLCLSPTVLQSMRPVCHSNTTPMEYTTTPIVARPTSTMQCW